MSLRIKIDDNCQGHGRCYDTCPEVFEPDNEGFSVVKTVIVEDGFALADLVRRAANGCPERAIHVEA